MSQIRLRSADHAIEVLSFRACPLSPGRDAAENQIFNTMAK
jgi:hypothetical protein